MTDNLIINNSIEISLRILVLFNELEKSIDLQRVIYYDYALLHSADFDKNQKSLHPPSPFRKEELVVKNNSIKEALSILCQKQLINIEYNNEGIFYKKNDLTPLLIQHLKSDYVAQLRCKSKWINATFNNYEDQELLKYFDDTIGKWNSEFSMYGLTNMELKQNV